MHFIRRDQPVDRDEAKRSMADWPTLKMKLNARQKRTPSVKGITVAW
jgi:hypothetical protein